ncbi:MAG: type II secretion system protein [Candidatus Omnitrophica bacterium]|nr:type II secretion system protein [Candidatus Omnitrophota bacterium]
MKWKKGLTLLEIVVGMAIFIVSIVSLLGAYMNVLAMSEGSRNLNTALNDVSRVIEEMRNIPFSSITLTDWTTWAQNNGANTLENETVTVSYQGADPLTVTVIVNWTEKSRQRSTSLVTAITQR